MANIDKEKLTIPIYLNTKIVFDMLATIEDGFSEVRNVQTSNSKTKEDETNADIGVSNVFSLLQIGFAGNRKRTNNDEQVITEEKTHTTVSLFQKLKSALEENKYIKQDTDELLEGDFVELQGILKPNPLIDLLVNFKEIIALSNVFNDSKGNKSKSQKLMENQTFNKQIEALINGLQGNGRKDIICKTDNMEIVVPTDENYFFNKSMCELTDGNYKILGKITKICGSGENISLLRNTAFSKFKLDKLNEFQDLLKEPSLSKIIDPKDIKTVVEGPTLMVIPIAIYI